MVPELDAWARESRRRGGQLLMVVCILRGGVFFFSDLVQAMTESIQPAFCRCHAYQKGVNGCPAEALRIDLPEPVRNRSVLLVDSICDSGRTLRESVRLCGEQGASTVRTAVLVRRLRPDTEFTPDFSGFEYPGTDWLAGYGLRDGDEAMNLPGVFRVVTAEGVTA
jgi:hypoxanthine phosphoribosyltransferase